MNMNAPEFIPPKFAFGANGGVRVTNVDEFFAQPAMQARLERMRKIDFVGKKLVGNKLVPVDEPASAACK